MRTIPVVLLLALGCLATPARAGLYNFVEPVPQIPPGLLLNTIKDLRSLAVPLQKDARPTPGTLRFNYQTQLEHLEAVRRERPLTVTERADLGAVYIRFGKIGEAIAILGGKDNQHFLLQANLAIAYAVPSQQQNWRKAVEAQEKALELWPTVQAGWPLQQAAWYRYVDRYLLRLLEARKEQELREIRRSDKGTRQPEQLDPLFLGVKFVGSDGQTYALSVTVADCWGTGALHQAATPWRGAFHLARPSASFGEPPYEAGALVREMADLLPRDALQIVLQLVVWLPGDNRLCWLLAELLNAAGAVEPAADILIYLRDNGFNPPGLHAHRGILREAVPVVRELRDATKRGQLLASLTLPPLFAPPGLGAAAQGTGAVLPVLLLPRFELGGGLGASAPPAPDSLGGPPNILPDWRHVTVGFLAGGLVAFLLGLQWQEWMRRRGATSQPAPPRIPEGPVGGRPGGQPPGDETGVTQTLPSSHDPAQT